MMYYTIKHVESGWDILESDALTDGKRLVTHVKGSHANAYKRLFEHLNNGRKRSKGIHRIEKAESGWNIFKFARLTGEERFIMHVKGSYEDAHAWLIEDVINSRKLLNAIFNFHDGEDPNFKD